MAVGMRLNFSTIGRSTRARAGVAPAIMRESQLTRILLRCCRFERARTDGASGGASGDTVAAGKAAVQRVKVPPRQLPDSGA